MTTLIVGAVPCACVDCDDPCMASPTGKGYCQDCWMQPDAYDETRYQNCHTTYPRDWACRFCGADASTPHWVRCPAWGATPEVNHA